MLLESAAGGEVTEATRGGPGPRHHNAGDLRREKIDASIGVRIRPENRQTYINVKRRKKGVFDVEGEEP